jgi:DNA-binding response OmpR family regulator
MTQSNPNNLGTAGVIQTGQVVIDLLGMMVRIHGEELPLQPLQVRILALLAAKQGVPVTDGEIRERVFRAVQTPGSTNIARQISLLRSALGPHRDNLRTVRGLGYSYAPTP